MRVRAPHHRHHGPVGRVCKIDGFTRHARKAIRAVHRFGTWAIATIGSRSASAARFLMPKGTIAYSPGLPRSKKPSAVLRRPRNGSRRASAPSRGPLVGGRVIAGRAAAPPPRRPTGCARSSVSELERAADAERQRGRFMRCDRRDDTSPAQTAVARRTNWAASCLRRSLRLVLQA
jgi:hypothetical protein